MYGTPQAGDGFMRIRRRGSVSVEALMVLPVAVVMIFLGRFVLEASLNRQETAVFARGSAVAAAASGSTAVLSCDFDRQDFDGRPAVEQSATVTCSRRSAEGGLSREQPMWDEVEEGAAPWDEILRDVKPRNGPRDILASARATMTFDGPAFLEQQDPTLAAQGYLSPERTLWTHGEGRLDEGHDRVIWDELCLHGTYWLFPRVFRHGGGPRC